MNNWQQELFPPTSEQVFLMFDDIATRISVLDKLISLDKHTLHAFMRSLYHSRIVYYEKFVKKS